MTSVTTCPGHLRETFLQLQQQAGPHRPSQLDAYFATLVPLQPHELLGNWRGGHFASGSWFDLPLQPNPVLAWHGKRFRSTEDVNALIMQIPGGARFPLPILGSAVIRPLEFRHSLSTAMIYNYLPIIDHFRKIDHHTVMGIMTLKGRTEVYFYLQRE
ncbi:MAG: DUF4334 domain-containing protein [Zetaproteobacteria bacterium]|nr:DUF4334 domain-containing protein [Zetaproteobacteria bacterium]